ncbi:hypothetical protein [Thermococcus sp. 21S9]|uniref:hypothetical protein n=1 Tax=Thermococcus sp. 21S9 TaxID=1638223 RepID=UPI00143B6CB6|nr:hypothetical protein [Thermococcus sp. 21S9]NJE54684.1 hypothetical protein [Thermococcus sp. 21S9]
MKLDCFPFPSAGKPLVLRVVGWLLIAVSLLTESGSAFLAGVVLVIASTGRDVVIDGGLVLRYALFKIRVSDVDEILCLSELERGRLVKWVTPLVLEPFFLVLSLLILLKRGTEVSVLLPALLYWIALYSEMLIFPLKVLKERLGLSVLVPLLVSLPLALLHREALPAMLFVWGTGTLSLMNLLLRDGVVIRTKGRSYLLLCGDSRRLMGVLANVPKDD